MGYSYRNNGAIQDFTPDDDDRTIYIRMGGKPWTFKDICVIASTKWGKPLLLSSVTIEAEYIHTHRLTNDQYESSDWTMYLVIRKIS